MKKLTLLAALFSTSVFAWTPTKNIDFIIPWKPGGGFDLTARMLIPGLEEYFGNTVNIIPRNEPGAGGRTAAGRLFSRVEPDGHTVMMFNTPGHADAYINNQEEPLYDVTQFTFLNTVTSDEYVIAVKKGGKFKTLSDLQKEEVILESSPGVGNTTYIVSQLVWPILGVNVKQITGYGGMNPSIKAVIGGETDVVVVPITTALRNDDLLIIVYLNQYPEWKSLVNVKTVVGPPGMEDNVATEWTKAITYAAGKSTFQINSVGGQFVLQDSPAQAKQYVFEIIETFR